MRTSKTWTGDQLHDTETDDPIDPDRERLDLDVYQVVGSTNDDCTSRESWSSAASLYLEDNWSNCACAQSVHHRDNGGI